MSEYQKISLKIMYKLREQEFSYRGISWYVNEKSYKSSKGKNLHQVLFLKLSRRLRKETNDKRANTKYN